MSVLSPSPRSSRRRWIALTALVAALALCVPTSICAHAGFGAVSVARICGLAECRELEQPLELFHTGTAQGPKAVRTTPSRPGPYYELELRFTGPPPAFFVPATGAVRGYPDPFGAEDPAWLRIEPAVEAALRATIAGIEPFPAPALTHAWVGGREVANPHAYLDLYDDLPPADTAAEELGGTEPVKLAGERLSPWSDGYNELAYERDRKLLVRDSQVVRPSRALIRLLERPAPASGSHSTVLLSAMGACSLLVLVFVAHARVRRPVPRGPGMPPSNGASV